MSPEIKELLLILIGFLMGFLLARWKGDVGPLIGPPGPPGPPGPQGLTGDCCCKQKHEIPRADK